MNPGDRVVVVKGYDTDAVYFYGYGVYEGDFCPGAVASHLIAKGSINLAIPMPRIHLDNGEKIYSRSMWSPGALLDKFPLSCFIHVDLSMLYKSIRRIP